jgi:hypothetical protein
MVGAVLASVLVVPLAVTAGSGVATGAPSTQFKLVDRARHAGLDMFNKTWAATAVDFNRDGDQDVWVGLHGRGARLFKNRGNGTYVRVKENLWPANNRRGQTIDRHDCDWADVDRNGRPDAYCTTGRFTANLIKYRRDNELWLQSRTGKFREVGTAWRIGDVCGRGRHVEFLDANGDRWPDLFLGNGNPRTVKDPCNRPNNGLPNEKSKLFINRNGNGFRYAPRFVEFGFGPGTECAEALDFNGDGREDLFACQAKKELPRLYVNRANRRLVEVTPQHGLTARINDAVAADIDNDRDPDLVTASGRGFAYHLNVSGRFQEPVRIGTRAWGKSVAVGDAENDGDKDVFAVVSAGQQANRRDVLYLNTLAAPGAPPDFSTTVAAPPAGGAADQAVALNPTGTGRAAFLVLNGFGMQLKGPVQFVRMIRQ